jgi:methylenetetrahydrofolate reductase (NADPH)
VIELLPKEMHIQEILSGKGPKFSFEFFPPKTEDGAAGLAGCVAELRSFSPAFVSVTYGAGGSTSDRTHDCAVGIQNGTGIPTIPHLTCVGQCEKSIDQILKRYVSQGIGNLLALRGDPPKSGGTGRSGDFRHAADLVKWIRRFAERHGHPDRRGFGIGVAGFPEGHPATPNRMLEMDYLKAKVDAGADYICTQLFLDNHDFYDFRDRCELAGIRIPILAGIMPVTSEKSLTRIAELAGGARFPAVLLKSFRRAGGNAEAERRVGIHYATEQCADLLDQGVTGIHFYTLNQPVSTREILRNLGVKEAREIENWVGA